MKKFYLILLTILLGIQVNVFAQTDGGVSIGKGDADADPSAILELVSNNKGLLVPRMTTTQRVAIVSPAEGLVVYDTTLGSFFLYGKTAWSFIHSGDIVSATTAPASTNNTLYYNTTEKQLYAYVSGAWTQVGTKEQLLSLTGSTLNLIEKGKTTGTSVDLSSLLQLGLTGTTVKISGGNSIDLSPITNKSLSLSGYILTLDNSTADFTSLFAGKVDKTTTINGQPLSGNVNISIPTSVSQLTNDAGYITSAPTTADATTSATGKIQLAGDLAGTATVPKVVKIQTVGVSATVPASGQVLKFDGTNWTPGADNTTGGASGATLPLTGTTGDTFFNTSNGTLYVYDATATPAWQPLSTGGSGTTSATVPGSPSTGDTYLNTADGNMYYYDGFAWVMLNGTATGGSAPAAPNATGETYFNTGNNTLYVYDGVSWVAVGSTAATLAGGTAGSVLYQSAANTTAFTTVGTTGQVLTSTSGGAPIWANGGGSTGYAVEPAVGSAGATYYNTVDKILYVSNGTTWEPLSTGGSTIALGSEPTSPVAGDVYYNTGDTNMYYYDGSVWIVIGKVATDTTPPTGTGVAGETFYDSTTNTFYISDGTAWDPISQVTVDNVLTSISTTNALSAAQGKVLNDSKAPLASPALTGTPTAPTATAGTSTTQIATTAFVVANAAVAPSSAIAPAVGSAGATYYNTVDKILYVSNGTTWEPLSTGGSTIALGSEPTSPVAGDVYYNTGDTNMYYYDGSVWIVIGKVATDTTPPTGTGVAGETFYDSTTNTFYISDGTAWDPISQVTVDNVLTSISTTNALSAAQGKVLNDSKAPLASPALTGTPTAPTATAGTSTTQIATTAFVVANAAVAPSSAIAPAVGAAGATYYNTVDKILYVSNGTTWEPLSTGGSTIASGTVPTSPVAGDVYYNTADYNIYYYDGIIWNMLNGVATGSTPPATGTTVLGETYFDTDNNTMYVYNGTTWIPVGTGDMLKSVYDPNDDGIVNAAVTATTATSATTATTATNIAAGTANSIPYQTGADATSFLAAGTSGYVLQTNGAGSAPSWVAPSGGVTTIGALGGSIANGASISTNTLTLGTADGTNPGLVSTAAQTFAGAKTFSAAPIVTPFGAGVVHSDVSGLLSSSAIVNADVDAAAAIAGSKISPAFTSDISTTGDATISGADLTLGVAATATSGKIVLNDANVATNTATLAGPLNVGTSYTLTLPNDLGTVGQVLSTDASGNLSWVDATVGNAAITAGTKTKITYDTKGLVTAGADATAADIVNVAAGNILATNVQAALNELDTEKEPVITILSPAKGGTGVNNGTSTITLGGNLTTSGAYTTALAATANTSVTLPTSGTLATLENAESITGLKTFDKDKVAMKGTSTGVTTLSTANTSATNYTIALPAADGTVALTSDVISFNLLGDITGTPGATTIASDVIVNADVKSDAAIAGTKIAPDFGSQVVTTTGAVAGASFTAGTGAGTTAGSVVLNDATAGDSFTATIKSPTAIPANYTLTLPADDGTADQVLKTDGAGALSWTTPSNGVTDLSYTPSATDGIVVSNTGTDATIPAADGTNAGLVSTGVQTFAGNKTLSGATTFTGNVSQTGATTFGTGTGAVSLNGNTTVTGTNTFSTGTGAVAINGDASMAAGKSLTYTAGAGNFDQSASTGTFKTGTGAVAINGDATLAAAKSLKLTDATTNTIALKAPATVTPYTLTLPDGVGANGSVLSTDASGNLSWNVLGAGGVASLGTPAAATDGNGGSITGTTLTLSLATAANPGLVSTASQTFAGAKTFSGAATFSAAPTVSTFGAGVVHSNGSGLLGSSLIVNADVDAAAAIAGSKIVPAFGAQDISNSGNFTQTGASTFSTGTGAISLNGDATLAAGKTLTLTGAAGTVGLSVPATVTAPYTLSLPADDGTVDQFLTTDGAGVLRWSTPAGAGTVTSVSVTTANGISGTVATATITPAITLDLAAITPTSVAINASKTSADASAALDITSTSKGILIPRMTKVEREAIAVSAATDGLMVYQTDDIKGFYYYNGTNWLANNTERVLNVTNVPDDDYIILPTDDILLLNHSSLRKLIFPTSGIPVGKRFYISNIGSQNYEIWPLDAMRDDASPAATVLQASYTFMYIGGTVDSYICVSGY